MNPELEREFGHVKDGQDRIEKHLEEQDKHQSTFLKAFNEHVLKDTEANGIVSAHLAEHKEAKKWRFAITSGIILTAISTVGMLIVEILKHFFMKG